MGPILLSVRRRRPVVLNRLLRGAHPLERSKRRRRELEALRGMMVEAGGRPDRALQGPLVAVFVSVWAGARPDVDGQWKLVGDALQPPPAPRGLPASARGWGWIDDDAQVEALLLCRRRVRRLADQGFDVLLLPAPATLALELEAREGGALLRVSWNAERPAALGGDGSQRDSRGLPKGAGSQQGSLEAGELVQLRRRRA